MTEAGSAVLQCYGNDSLEIRTTTVGCPTDHTEVKIVDHKGNTVPRGKSGELCVRSYSIMQGYWGDPEKTGETISDEGWLHTG